MDSGREATLAPTSQMAIRSAEHYIAAHRGEGGVLSLAQLGEALVDALQDGGMLNPQERSRVSAALVEEYALRAGGMPIGPGGLTRLLAAAQQCCVASACSGTSMAHAGERVVDARGVKRLAPADEAGTGKDSGCAASHQEVAKSFDAAAKEAALQSEATSWAAPSASATLPLASEDDIPTIDLSALSQSPDAVGTALRQACAEVGFHFIVGHGLTDTMLERGEQAVKMFSRLPADAKSRCLMDAGPYPGGIGYLPVHSRKLPKRPKGNVVEAFIVKRESGPRRITLDDMPWPQELGPMWREEVEAFARAMEELALRMLPAYSLALREHDGYLAPAFQSPLWRLRMSHYPAVSEYDEGQYGIAPHVDTSFFTILHRIEHEPGLVVWSAKTHQWVRVPTKPGALLVNTGEILRQVSNDTFLSARHYVLNESRQERISLAFFFNATADFKMSVAAGAGGGPAKYPPTSYLDGQGVVQGE